MTTSLSWLLGTTARSTGLGLLAAAWTVAALACGSPGEAPASQQLAEQKKTAVHKVQLSAEQVLQLERRGVSTAVLADYGAFKLVQVDDRALASLPEGAELRDDYDRLLLNAGTIDTASAHGQSLRGLTLPASGKRFHLVQFAGPIQPQWHQQLAATGVQVVTYIPHNAYLVYGDATTLGALQQHIRATSAIQWNGDYLDDYKLNPAIHTAASETYEVQLIQDAEANGATLELIRQLQSRDGTIQEALGYINVHTYLTVRELYEIAARPDVLSIQPRPMPRKLDERQNMIISGNITGTNPSGPGYLGWLASKGFTQTQFIDSDFGVDVSDSGLDNGTVTPNHFGLYVGGDVSANSRVAYVRLEGTPHAGGTIQGCDGHGTLDAHIVAGYVNQTGAPFTDDMGFIHGLGVAPFVKVGASVVFDPSTFTSPDYEDLQSRAYRDTMRISTNSWGAAFNSYTSDSQRYDALVRDAQQEGSAVPGPGNQEMVIVFAAGNSGSGAASVGFPATAKNVITAGASENVRAFGVADACGVDDTSANNLMDVAFFSSRGPTADGRKKPDLMAPGTHVSGGVAQAEGQRANPPANPNGQALSCFNAGGVCGGPGGGFYPTGLQWYTASSGTSHSTPAIAGGAALVRQYFINQGMAPPSPAMTKAYLMNSARYMTGSAANDTLWSNNQGMGLMDLGMAFDGTARMLDDQSPGNLFTATGETRTFNGVAADSSKPFRVTLAWTDAPGSTTGSAFKNNLDLTVTVGGSTYKGNVFSGASSVTGGTADGANNVESVFLPAGTEGPFTITVTAANINSDGVPGNSSALDQDFALIAYNTCNTAPEAPTGVTATVNGNNRIDVAWTQNGANAYRVYRATRPGGPYTRLATVEGSSYSDIGVSGGTTYYYVVRGMLCAESPSSSEVSVTATGQCTLAPTFAGLASASATGANTCATALSWAPATPICGGTVTYSVYRSTTSGFTPSIANRIATGLTGTSFADDLNLVSGTRYSYVVRATETSNATNEETNTVERSSVPTGPVTGGVHFDDLDGNRPPNADAYWIATTQSGTSGTINRVSGCRFQSATHAYRFGATSTSCSGSYPDSTSATLSLGGNGSTAGINGFNIPEGAVSPQLTFNVWYSFESGWDGAWLAYSTAGATGPWTAIGDTASTTAPYISAGGYNGTISGVSNRVWTSSSTNANGALKAVTVNLNALTGRTVWFAFRFHTDSSVVSEGFYVDDVRLNTSMFEACTTNTPPPGPAVSFQVSALPASTRAGELATFTATALDAVGQRATSYSGSASFSSTDAQATLPPITSFTAGVATNVPVTFRTLGTQSITAADTVNPSITGSSSTSVTAGPPAGLAFTTQPAETVAGAFIAPSVKVSLVDQFGNIVGAGTNTVTLALGNNPGGGTLSGTTTVTMVAGVATFSSLSLNKTGTGYTLVASSSGLTGATSAGFRITPATASKLAFLTQPSNGIAGAPFAPAVQVVLLDRFDNATTSTAPVTVALGSNPAGGTLGGTTTVAAVNGVATFGDIWINTVGTGYTLAATSGRLTGATSRAFDLISGPPHRVSITRQPTSITGGAVINPPVQATLFDQYGNLAAQSTAAVSVSIGNNPSGGTLSGTTTVNAVGGVATFNNLSVDCAGRSYTLVAGGSGLFTDTSVGFDVLVGPPSRLTFTTSPSGSVVQGAPFSVQVAVRDAGGNPINDASTRVTLSLLNAPGATLSGTTTVAAVNGVATFTGLAVDRSGSGYMLLAEAAGLSSATSPAFSVNPDANPGAPVALVFVTQPSNITAGSAITPAISVALRDSRGNTVTSSADITLTLANNAAGGTLRGTRTVAAVNGVATFADLTVDRAGTGYTLRASSGALTSTSTPFNVAVGPAARLVFRSSPANTGADSGLGPVAVEIQDSSGNLILGSTAQVALSLGGPSGGTLGGTTTVAANNGVATFPDLFIRRAGTGYTLTATSTGLQEATSGAFNIVPGAAVAVAFNVQPSNVRSGAILSPAVKAAIQDAHGNIVPSASQSISLALASNPSGGTLGGTTTVAAIDGVATFGDLLIFRAGTGYRLTATSGALTSATSAAFDVTAGRAQRLVFQLSPGNTAAGANLGTVSVEIQDAEGNRADVSNSISLSLQGGQGGTLSGTTTVAASNGVAVFNDLSISRAAAGYRLTAYAQGLLDASSAAFDISHGPAAALAFTVQPGNTPAGTTISPAVKVALQDAFGNVATSATNAITLAMGNNPRNGTLTGTTTVSAINGVATFADLSINRNGQGYTLAASSGALTGATSAAFDITPGRGPKLIFRSVPSQVTAGEALPGIEVELQDELGNTITDGTHSVTLSLGDNTAGGQLFGRALVTVVNGVATFDGITLRKAGSGYTLVATAPGFAGATSTAFNVAPAAAATYALTFPASVTAGQEVTLSATAHDAFGNAAANYGGTVNVTNSDASAAFSATATFVEGVLPAFKVTFKSPGLRMLTFTDSANASLKATAQLNVTPFPQPTVSVTSPEGGTTVSGEVNITATGAVAPGTTLARISILVDGVVIASGTEPSLPARWDSSQAPSGSSHTITAIIIDGAGNVAASAPVTVTAQNGGCGCGATSGAGASLYLVLLVLARYVLGRRRQVKAV
jgi:hypothetical protein